MRKVSRWQLSGVPMLGLASILEQTVKSLHEANEHPSTDASEQYTILDGLKLLSDDKFRSRVLAKVSDPYLLEWWGRDFRSWHRQYKAYALAPTVTTRARMRILIDRTTVFLAIAPSSMSPFYLSTGPILLPHLRWFKA